MKVHLAYGRGTLEVVVPDRASVDVIEPRFVQAIADPDLALNTAFEHPINASPLRDLVKPGDRVGVVVSDITRPTPYPVILPVLFEHLSAAAEIVIFVATGTHRPNTQAELRLMLGDEAADHHRVVQNNCEDAESHRLVGTTGGGNDIWLLSEFLDCDVRIPTGFIEPHFFAGFSGGGKAIMPGLALLETIGRNHNAAHMDHSKAGWGILHGNPLWEEVCEAALFANPSFLLNVTLNRNKDLTGVYAGDFVDAHAAGCNAVRESAMAKVTEPYDIVITSNSGYPLDLNLYQSVKGMSAAARVVKPGGHIIVAADCWDGIPNHGTYGRLLADAESPDALLSRIRTPGFAMQDQWQAQIHANIVRHAHVHFYSHNLTPGELESAFLIPCSDVTETVDRIVSETGEGCRICVLPEGPQTIPYLR